MLALETGAPPTVTWTALTVSQHSVWGVRATSRDSSRDICPAEPGTPGPWGRAADPETEWPTPPRPWDQPQAPQPHPKTAAGAARGSAGRAGACVVGDGWAVAEGRREARAGPRQTHADPCGPFPPLPNARHGGGWAARSDTRPSGVPSEVCRMPGGRARSPAGRAGRAPRGRGRGASTMPTRTTEYPSGRRLGTRSVDM